MLYLMNYHSVTMVYNKGLKQMFYLMNYYSMTMVYSGSQTNVLSHELSFSENGLFRVSNKCSIYRMTIQCL